jgi:outer membrane immunogenic protein
LTGTHFEESAAGNLPLGIGGPFAPGAPNSFSATHSSSPGGFALGTGVEYALGSNLSAKLEYDYMEFGSHDVIYVFTLPQFALGGTTRLGVEEHERIHLIKAGLNYRFNYWH